ncbi:MULTISPECIES: DUF1178 family protein [unclassified Caulobacter]|jgi:hypothetical protein|uniref:DUF1178 family protein n=1 Tax=unclassified Caulobacter TaxID=2648921 RepID=UPI0006FAB11E|nr:MULTISPECIES: DUF1178 family protein [unclassified Caulobacter]KQV58878.1 hypothetical protein ASC62_08940 [Caulobacter sp. Root342]KQV68612.1 hypothetical protein ASC70_07095 [Caulobacter sp. Root343]
MIKYALQCDAAHEFEGWFGASADYDDQVQRGLIQCPVCGSTGVSKQIMAPAVAGTKARRAEPAVDPKMREMMMTAMGEVRRHVEENFDNVGDAFAKEARAIHEGKSEERGIYGEASPAEVKALVEDGVRVAPLPPAAPKKTDVN